MFGVHPLAVHDVTAAQDFIKRILVDIGPLLHKVIVPLSVAAGEVMAPALEQQFPFRAEGNGGICAVALLLNYQVSSLDLSKGDLGQVFVAGLQAGTHQVRCSGIFFDGFHGFSLLFSRQDR